MASQVILSVLLLALVSWSAQLHEAARILPPATYPSGTSTTTTTTPTPPTTTTTTSTTTFSLDTYIEDPSDSATSESSEEEEFCARCFYKVQAAQKMFAIQLQLVRKVDKLTKLSRQRNKAMTSSTGSPERSRNSPRRSQNQNNSAQSSVPSTRSLTNEPIVVSTLRVARSAASTESDIRNTGLAPASTLAKKGGFKKDLSLKQLKHKQEQQLKETCKALHDVERCLSEISRECTGDLTYHSHDTYSRQWHNKLNCPPSNNPTARIFPLLTRTATTEPDETTKMPIPRPISSDEEIARRIKERFGPGGPLGPPIGVMLKPTLTDHALQKFDSLGQPQQQQQHRVDDRYPEDRHIHHYARVTQEPRYIAISSQVLLIPCCLILIVAIIALSNRYIEKLENRETQ